MWILRSYRWRRRALFSAIAIGVAAPLIWLAVRYSHAEDPRNANGPTVANPVQAKDVPFKPVEQQAVHKVLKRFIGTAVVRHDVSEAWSIAGPTLKEGVSRRQWDKGEIPVTPYPALDRGWGDWSYVEYSQKEAATRQVGLEVYLFPQPGSGWSAMSADVEVIRSRKGPWLVDYWMPKRFHGPPALSQKAKAKAKTQAKAKVKKLRERHNAKKEQALAREKIAALQDKPIARGAWWALPLGILGLAIVLPVSIGLFVWYRNRKAERDYFRSSSR